MFVFLNCNTKTKIIRCNYFTDELLGSALTYCIFCSCTVFLCSEGSVLFAPYPLVSSLLCSPRHLLQFTDSLTAETTLSEVRVRQFFLPIFCRGQVGTHPSPSSPLTSSLYLISPRCLPSSWPHRCDD